MTNLGRESLDIPNRKSDFSLVLYPFRKSRNGSLWSRKAGNAKLRSQESLKKFVAKSGYESTTSTRVVFTIMCVLKSLTSLE